MKEIIDRLSRMEVAEVKKKSELEEKSVGTYPVWITEKKD